jgi:7-cyano-7-deazaguanine synthase in queuosine biosynthesis
MGNPNNKIVYCTWSGGIDSTGVIGQLLKHGWEVKPVTLVFGESGYRDREAIARGKLLAWFTNNYPGKIQPIDFIDGSFLTNFAAGNLEAADIPRRNKHILDFMMTHYVIPNDGYYVGMGEYIGADTWLVKDHVGMHDCDARHFVAYLLAEYGLNYRYISLADFGESRYKADRVRLLVDAVGPKQALLTSNCMFGTMHEHCGKCYKCIERHVAFEEVLGSGFDTTVYLSNPKDHVSYIYYLKQMAGELVDLPWEVVNV